MTLAEAMQRGGKEPPDYSPSYQWMYIVEHFWRLKQFVAELSDPIQPRLVKEWCECQDVVMTKSDRSLIYELDHSFRVALANRRAENDRYFANKQSNR